MPMSAKAPALPAAPAVAPPAPAPAPPAGKTLEPPTVAAVPEDPARLEACPPPPVVPRLGGVGICGSDEQAMARIDESKSACVFTLVSCPAGVVIAGLA